MQLYFDSGTFTNMLHQLAIIGVCVESWTMDKIQG